MKNEVKGRTERPLQKPPLSPRMVSAPRGCCPWEALIPALVSELATDGPEGPLVRGGRSTAHRTRPTSSWKGGPVGRQEGSLQSGRTLDSLLMRCGRGLAEGALSEGSRCSQTGTLSWHRGNAHFLLGASLPSAQAPQGRPQLLGRQSQVKERHPMALTLAFLPHSRLDFQKWLLPPE